MYWFHVFTFELPWYANKDQVSWNSQEYYGMEDWGEEWGRPFLGGRGGEGELVSD
jgi:hypothetical protein